MKLETFLVRAALAGTFMVILSCGSPALAQTNITPINDPVTDTLQLWGTALDVFNFFRHEIAVLFDSLDSPVFAQRHVLRQQAPALIASAAQAAAANPNSPEQQSQNPFAAGAPGAGTAPPAKNPGSTGTQLPYSSSDTSSDISAQAPLATYTFPHFISEDTLDTKLQQLSNAFQSSLGSISASGNTVASGGVWNAIAGSGIVNQLSGVVINNPSINGGTLSNVSLSSSEIPDLSGTYLKLSGGTLTGALISTSPIANTFTASIGIGTTSPQTTLGVTGSGYFTSGLGIGVLNTSAGTLQTAGNATIGATLTASSSIVNTNFGIGTTSPFARLSIAGSSGDTTNLISVSTTTNFGLVTQTSFYMSSDGSGHYMNGTGLDLGYGSVPPTSGLITQGNVGIGTNNPTSLLTVNGTASTSGLVVSGIANGSGQCLQINASGVVSGTGSVCGGTGSVPGGSNGAVQFDNGGVFAGNSNLFWDNTNVRLGVASSTPAATLSIGGNGSFAGGLGLGIVNTATGTVQWGTGLGSITHLLGPADQPFTIKAGAVASGNGVGVSITGGNGVSAGTGGTITITGGIGGGTGADPSGGVSLIGGASENNNIGAPGGGITLTGGAGFTTGGASNGSVSGPISISSGVGGNGTGAASVAGISATSTITTGTGGAATSNSGGTGGSSGPLQLSTGAGGSATGSGGTRNGGNSGSITLQTGAGGTGASANGTAGTIAIGVGGATNMFFNSSGLIGIGTTSPYSRLEVWGTDTASTSAFVIANSASTTVFAVYDNGNATYSGSIFQSSDQRLKTNIQSLDASSSLAAVNALHPVTFNWADPGRSGQPQLGFLAQQVGLIFPDLISTTSPTALTPDGTLSLNYIGLIAPIVRAIQALSSEIASIEQTIAGFAISFTSQRGSFTNELCVGSTCVTPEQFQAMVAAAGQLQSPQNGSSDATTSTVTDASTTPPVIHLNGDNPAIIAIGETYSDLGAIITGPQQDLNLGITTYVNGAPMNPVQLDTSQAATDTIDYIVTDQNGLASTSTRTVIVEAPQTSEATSSGTTSP